MIGEELRDDVYAVRWDFARCDEKVQEDWKRIVRKLLIAKGVESDQAQLIIWCHIW